jgi:hypothetical protein
MYKKYIDICSSKRDRSQFPNPNEFNINFEKRESKDGFNSSDFICDAFGYELGSVHNGVPVPTITTVPLPEDASSINNFYVNSIIQVEIGGIQYFRKVIAYDGVDQFVTVSPAFPSSPMVGNSWIMRRDYPVYLGVLQAGSTTSSLKFAADNSDVDDYYKGMYVSIPSLNSTVIISAYDGASKTATVSPSLSVAPGLISYEILRFTRANDQGLSYSGSQYGRTQYVNHEITLTNLYLPRLDVLNSGGGSIADYPYVYVEFGNINNTSSTMYSNNSYNSRHSLFKVPISNNIVTGAFISLSCDMSQVIKYKPNSDHTFTVRVPNGEVLKYEDDNFYPDIPNSRLQTSVTFCIRQI